MFNSSLFENKKVLIGLSGGIAAYKTCEFIRFLITAGAEVRVMMTAAAREFITPLTLETLSRHPVYLETFPAGEFSGTHHVHLADWAEAAAILPATANVIAKLAAGIADDFVTTTWLALSGPRMVAPAMNSHMWANPIVQRNIKTLEDVGHIICPPETGFLAEGYQGEGRLARLEYLVQYLYRAVHPVAASLSGRKVLITAGRTEERWDPVRILTNRSSGKMGCALALEAFARGADVTLIHGPMDVEPPASVETVAVESAAEMSAKVLEKFDQTDIYLSAAAVADYRPAESVGHKIKKNSDLVLPLKKTADILKLVEKRRKPGQLLIGFAMESENFEQNALEKMAAKKLDGMVLNRIGGADAAFQNDYNQVTLFSANGKKTVLKRALKLDVARQIFDFFLNP